MSVALRFNQKHSFVMFSCLGFSPLSFHFKVLLMSSLRVCLFSLVCVIISFYKPNENDICLDLKTHLDLEMRWEKSSFSESTYSSHFLSKHILHSYIFRSKVFALFLWVDPSYKSSIVYLVFLFLVWISSFWIIFGILSLLPFNFSFIKLSTDLMWNARHASCASWE